MSLEENKAVVRRLFEEMITEGRLEVAEEIFAPDFVWPQFDLHGPEGAKQWVRNFRAAFPDLLDTVEEQIAEDDRVMSRVRIRATNQGVVYGMPPTGTYADFTAVGIDRLREGRIVERFAIYDPIDLMQQLGHDTVSIRQDRTASFEKSS